MCKKNQRKYTNIQFNGLESKQTLGDSERQGRLMSCSPWGHKELDTT